MRRLVRVFAGEGTPGFQFRPDGALPGGIGCSKEHWIWRCPTNDFTAWTFAPLRRLDERKYLRERTGS
jgi:hypothetical protein